MDVVYVLLGWLMLGVGLVGCFVPVLPGPTIAYASLFVPWLMNGPNAPSVRLLALTGVLTAVVTILDYIVPALGAKKFNCSRWGTAGCFIGTFVGIFFLPLGVLAGPFLGALVGELIAGKCVSAAMRGALGALLGYVFGLVLKVVTCLFLAYCYWISLPT